MDIFGINRPQLPPEELKRQRDAIDARKKRQAPDLPKPMNLKHVLALADDLKERYPMLEVSVSSAWDDGEVYIAKGSVPRDGYVEGFSVIRHVHNNDEHRQFLEELDLASGKVRPQEEAISS